MSDFDSQPADVTMPQQAPPSFLAQAVSQPAPQLSASSPEEQQAQADSVNPGGGSRLLAILGAVARVGTTALSGLPNSGRPGFVQGLGSGARAAQADNANQQELKFRSFQDQVRLAQLHNEDVRMQWASEDHQNAVQANSDAQAERMKSTTGMTYTFVPNSDGGKEALDHMGVQMAQNGAVSVPAGTIAGPKGWYIPNQGSEEQAQANTKDWNARATYYGFNPVPKGQVVQGAAYDQLRQASNGLDNQGHPMHANDLQGRVDNMTEQLAKYKGSANADSNTIAAVQNDIDHLTNLQKITAKRDADAVKQQTAQQLDTLNKSEAIKAKYAEQKQDNAAADKPQKPQNVDANGNPVWVPGVSADEKKKAELSENVVFNANNIASILQRRPDIVGKVSGRFTTLDQMAGTNDQDITSLQQDMHNIAIANVGIHGMRANDAVHDVEKNILNNFKNGPLAIGGALKSTANSVQTFIDNARPETYKTHTKKGGAIRSMIPQQGQ